MKHEFKFFRVKRDEPKWLETALYIDHTVIKFHGNDTVQAYILTLINIGTLTLLRKKFRVLKKFINSL